MHGGRDRLHSQLPTQLLDIIYNSARRVTILAVIDQGVYCCENNTLNTKCIHNVTSLYARPFGLWLPVRAVWEEIQRIFES